MHTPMKKSVNVIETKERKTGSYLAGEKKEVFTFKEATETLEIAFYFVPRVLVKNNCYTDGELDVAHVDNILKPLLCDFDIFLDVGCGTGLIVLQLAMTSNVGQLIGIEPVEKRLKTSAFYAMQKQLAPSIRNKMIFFTGTFEDVGLGNATVIYCCNVLFSPGSILEFTKQVLNSQAHTVVTYTELQDIEHVYRKKKLLQVKVSWTPNKVELIVYTRPPGKNILKWIRRDKRPSRFKQ